MNDSRFSDWRTATYTGGSGNCVEVAAGDWRKSSYSAANGGCVEVGAAEPIVGVRDTRQHGEGPVLEFPGAAWQAFLTDVKSGQLDC